jgi:hypothetical protein
MIDKMLEQGKELILCDRCHSRINLDIHITIENGCVRPQNCSARMILPQLSAVIDESTDTVKPVWDFSWGDWCNPCLLEIAQVISKDGPSLLEE